MTATTAHSYSSTSFAELEGWLRAAYRDGDLERARSIKAELDARFAAQK